MRTHADGIGVGHEVEASAIVTPRGRRRQAAPFVSSLSGARVHFIGIGGAGMSGAAAMLLNLGAKVSGSDITPFEGMGGLVESGALVAIGHRGGQLDPSADLVVISAAIKESNPELAVARAGGLQVVKYAELLGELMRRFEKGVAIAGTHGKSTTTAMCVHLFREAGLAPSFLVGARSAQLGGGSGLDAGSHLIVESCEFDRSFLHLAPESGAILNIERDHLDCYRDLDEIVDAFGDFADNIKPNGYLVCNADDRFAKQAAKQATNQGGAGVETFGFGEEADWRAVNLRQKRGCFEFDVCWHGSHLFSTSLSIAGRYNVANALAAIALAHHAGADPDALAAALPGFVGIDRRLSTRGYGRGVTIVDDYAHHPTEIRVTIEAVRDQHRPSRTWVIFQPHQHARTRFLMDSFAASFTQADRIVVLDVYGARETSGNGAGGVVSETPCAEILASMIRQNGGRAEYMPDFDNVAECVTGDITEGDLVLTMGAGDVWKVADELVERICRPNRA